MKVAETVLSPSCIVTVVVGLVPDASPLQPLNVHPGSATAVKSTSVPSRYRSSSGVRFTCPLPMMFIVNS